MKPNTHTHMHKYGEYIYFLLLHELYNYICCILTSCVRISHFFPNRVTSLISVEFESLASLFAEKITEEVRHVYRFCTHVHSHFNVFRSMNIVYMNQRLIY